MEVGSTDASSPPRSPVHGRPSTQPPHSTRKGPVVVQTNSSRLTKPPVPQFTSRSRRPQLQANGQGPQSAGEKAELQAPAPFESFGTPPECHAGLSLGNYVPGSFHPHMMPPAFGMYHPVIFPTTTLYGNIHQHQSATVVYTSGPIPANTTSIIIVPMHAEGHPVQSPPFPVSTPSPVSRTFSSVSPGVNGSISSENSGSLLSQYMTQPLIVLIERNAFKHWFDSNMPQVLSQLPRVKRYKSIETFMHWLTSKRKHAELKLIMLVRVTEMNKLISELNKEFPSSVMNSKILKNVFTYEHLFDLADQPGKSLKAVSDELVRTNRFSVSHCLEDACKLALESLASAVGPIGGDPNT